jgi:hypothetical protein
MPFNTWTMTLAMRKASAALILGFRFFIKAASCSRRFALATALFGARGASVKGK